MTRIEIVKETPYSGCMKLVQSMMLALALSLSFVKLCHAQTNWVETPNENLRQRGTSCLFSTQIIIRNQWDASITWRSGALTNKWSENAQKENLKCGAGFRLTRLRELSSDKLRQAVANFPALLPGYNSRCENGAFDSCRGFQISKDLDYVLVGSFKNNIIEEGVLFHKNGTNVWVSSFKGALIQPLHAAIFSNNEWLSVEAPPDYFRFYNYRPGVDGHDGIEPSLLFRTNSGETYKTVVKPLCRYFASRAPSRFMKPCYGMLMRTDNFYIGEMIQEAFKQNFIPHGTGILVEEKGDRFFGEFVQDKRHGMGITSARDGTKLQVGIWEDGEFKETLSQQEKRIAEYKHHNINQLCDLIENGGPVAAREELSRRGLTCNNPLASNNHEPTTKNNKPIVRQESKVLSSDEDKNKKQKVQASAEPKRVTPSSNPNKLCATVDKQLLEHITRNDYENAEKALSLLKKLNCSYAAGNQPSVEQKSNSNNSQKPDTPRFTAQQLSCFAGPLWKNKFGRDRGFFKAQSFDQNPKSTCQIAKSKCIAKAEAAAARTEYRENNNTSSYSARCNSYGRYNSADCTITPNNNSGGGFFGGFARGMANAMNESAVKGDAMISEFKVCMIDEGYSLIER